MSFTAKLFAPFLYLLRSQLNFDLLLILTSLQLLIEYGSNTWHWLLLLLLLQWHDFNLLLYALFVVARNETRRRRRGLKCRMQIAFLFSNCRRYTKLQLLLSDCCCCRCCCYFVVVHFVCDLNLNLVAYSVSMLAPQCWMCVCELAKHTKYIYIKFVSVSTLDLRAALVVVVVVVVFVYLLLVLYLLLLL